MIGNRVNLDTLSQITGGIRLVRDPVLLTLPNQHRHNPNLRTFGMVDLPIWEFHYTPQLLQMRLGSEDRPIRIDVLYSQGRTRIYTPIYLTDYFPVYQAIFGTWFLAKPPRTIRLSKVEQSNWDEVVNTGWLLSRIFFTNPTVTYLDLYHVGGLAPNPEYRPRSNSERALHRLLSDQNIESTRDKANLILSIVFDYTSGLPVGLIPLLCPFFRNVTWPTFLTDVRVWNFTEEEYKQIRATLLHPQFMQRLQDILSREKVSIRLAGYILDAAFDEELPLTLALLCHLAYQPSIDTIHFCAFTGPWLYMLWSLPQLILDGDRRLRSKLCFYFSPRLYFRRQNADRIKIFIGWLTALLEAQYYRLLGQDKYLPADAVRLDSWLWALSQPHAEEMPYLITLLGLLVALDRIAQLGPVTEAASKLPFLNQALYQVLLGFNAAQAEALLNRFYRCLEKATYLMPAAKAVESYLACSK